MMRLSVGASELSDPSGIASIGCNLVQSVSNFPQAGRRTSCEGRVRLDTRLRSERLTHVMSTRHRNQFGR